MVNIITFSILAVMLLLGYYLGLGRTIKLFTKGIVGILVATLFCFIYGGVLQNLDFVVNFINDLNTKFSEVHSLLGKIYLGYICYYLILFIFVQILRIIIIRILINVHDSSEHIINFISRLLGSIVCCVFIVTFVFLGLAILELLADTEFGIEVLIKIEGSILEQIYLNNPVKLLLETK